MGSVIGAYVAGTALGGFTGRVVVGALTDFISWKWALIVLGIINFALSIVFCLLLPASKNFRKNANMTFKHWFTTFKDVSETTSLCAFT